MSNKACCVICNCIILCGVIPPAVSITLLTCFNYEVRDERLPSVLLKVVSFLAII